MESGRCEGKRLEQVAVDYRQALVRYEKAREDFEAAQARRQKALAREEQLRRRRQEAAVRRHRLEPQRAIRQLDVALDSILTAAKLTLALLLTFALREYMPGSHMTPQTFISRVFGLRGRRTQRPGEEHIVFYENPRDPAVNQYLAEACRHLNQRALVRQGRRLYYAVEAAK